MVIYLNFSFGKIFMYYLLIPRYLTAITLNNLLVVQYFKSLIRTVLLKEIPFFPHKMSKYGLVSFSHKQNNHVFKELLGSYLTLNKLNLKVGYLIIYSMYLGNSVVDIHLWYFELLCTVWRLWMVENILFFHEAASCTVIHCNTIWVSITGFKMSPLHIWTQWEQ